MRNFVSLLETSRKSRILRNRPHFTDNRAHEECCMQRLERSTGLGVWAGNKAKVYMCNFVSSLETSRKSRIVRNRPHHVDKLMGNVASGGQNEARVSARGSRTKEDTFAISCLH